MEDARGPLWVVCLLKQDQKACSPVGQAACGAWQPWPSACICSKFCFSGVHVGYVYTYALLSTRPVRGSCLTVSSGIRHTHILLYIQEAWKQRLDWRSGKLIDWTIGAPTARYLSSITILPYTCQHRWLQWINLDSLMVDHTWSCSLPSLIRCNCFELRDECWHDHRHNRWFSSRF